MANSLRVIIGGKEYVLRGEDESLLQKVTQEVNSQLSSLENSHVDESATTLSILAALNIAEKHYKYKEQSTESSRYLINELNAMTEYLQKSIGQDFSKQ